MRIPIPRQEMQISQDETNFWKAEIKASLKRQKDEFITRTGYELNVRYFEALQCAEGAKINQMAIVDEFSPAIASIVRTTYYQNPTTITEALHPDAEKPIQPSILYTLQNPDFKPFSVAELINASVKYGMKKAGMKEEMQLADFDLLTAGFTAVEMNHASTTDAEEAAPMDKDTKEPENPIVDGILGAAKSAYGAVKNALGGSKSNEEVEESVVQEAPQERVDHVDSTYCKRWNPLEVIFDSRATVFKESRFVGKIIKKSVAEFNTMYPKFKGKIGASDMSQTMTYSSHKDPDNKKSVTLYEIEIKKKGPRNCILVVCDGIPEAVDYYEKPIVSNNFSIKYSSIDKYGKIYPMPRATKARKPQDDINHYMTIQFEHVDRAMRKIGVFMQGLSPSGQAAVKSADVYAVVEKIVPGPVFEAAPAPSVVPENKEIVSVMRDSINKELGTNELAKTGQSENDLLGQDELQSEAFQTNVAAVQDALQDLADDLLDELKDIIMQLWDGEDFFKVTGIQGGEQWYTPEMGPLADILVGDCLVKSEIATAARPNPMKDRRDSIQLAQFLTSGDIQAYLMARGKMSTLSPIDNVVKSFGQNPEMVYTDLPEPPVMPGMAPGVPGMPPQQMGGPKTIPVQPGPPNDIPEEAANGSSL